LKESVTPMSADKLREDASEAYGYNAEDGGFTTIALHHGHKLDTDNRARAPPIFQTTSFEFKSADHGAALFSLSELGPIYTRLMNPTTHVLEYKMAKLEGAKCPLHGNFDNAATLPSALAVSSGQSAQMHALLTIMKAGDEFIAAGELYGGTYTQFKYSFEQLGITVKWFDASKPEDIKPLIDPVKTKCIYIETISNPSATVPDFEAISKIAKEAKVPLVCDNTFGMGGYCCKPLKMGADIVVESATKWIGGHGTSIGGIIVDGSSFDWEATLPDSDTLKFPTIAGPQAAYHGGEFSKHELFGVKAHNTVFILLARVKTLRDMGGCISPFNAFQLIQGIETLALRCDAHCKNANALAEFLSGHEKVKKDSVLHPSLASHPSHELAKKYFRPGTYGSVFTFEIASENDEQAADRGKKFITALKMCAHLANVGDARTLVIHPASTTHQQLDKDQQKAAGVKPGGVRVSVGYEDFNDIKKDFEEALATACA